MDYGRGIVLTALLMSSAVGAYSCAASSGSGKNSLLTLCGALVLLLLCAITVNGRDCLNFWLPLSIAVLLLGTILGNFLGLHRYYRLRPRRKSRQKSTK